MKRKYRIDRLLICFIAILFLIICLSVFIINLFKTKSYSLEYKIRKISINENYDKHEKIYYYKITYNSLSYDFIYESNYIKERKLINGIKEYNEDNQTCLIIESKYFTVNPLCSIDNNLVDYHLISKKLYNKIEKYTKETTSTKLNLSNYEIYNTEDTKVLWNYKGINIIKGDHLETIKIFKKDFYDVPLSTLINNYFIVANYEQNYNYNSIYVIDIDTYEMSKWELDDEISFDSYILGTNDKSVYIVDKKNKKEYELVPHKQKMRTVSSSNGIIYEDGEEKNISMDTLVSQKYSFKDKNHYNYKIIDNTLYLSITDSDIITKVSNNIVDSIVSINKDNVFYLVGTTLYRYNLTYGEVKIMSYSEWEYNNTNVIFIK